MATRRVRVGKRQHTWVKWVVALGVLAVLGLAFAASVGIGNWLLHTAEQYPANEQTPVQSLPEDEILPVRVPPIKAQAYRIGDRYSSYTYAGVAHLCAPLRASDGSLAYASDVCARVGWDANGSAELSANAWELHKSNLYLCAYIPIFGFAEEDVAQRELVLSYEASLIAEAAQSGVDEIFLTGIEPTQNNVSDIMHYIARLKSLAGNTAVGIMIKPNVLLATRYDVFVATQLLEVCDFLVVDLRDLPLRPAVSEESSEEQTEASLITQELTVAFIMESMQYELMRYSPRLALGSEQTDALDYVISKGYENWLILGDES